jgi:hypothetical protein
MCGICGFVMCRAGSDFQAELGSLGYTEPQRVCATCWDAAQRTLSTVAAAAAAAAAGGAGAAAGATSSSVAAGQQQHERGSRSVATMSDDVLRLLLALRQMVTASAKELTYISAKRDLRRKFGDAVFERAKDHVHTMLQSPWLLELTVQQPTPVLARPPLQSEVAVAAPAGGGGGGHASRVGTSHAATAIITSGTTEAAAAAAAAGAAAAGGPDDHHPTTAQLCREEALVGELRPVR